MPPLTHNASTHPPTHLPAYPSPRAQILILLQDDQVPPKDDCKWLQHILDLFDHWPRLGAIGLRSGTWAFPWDLMNEHFMAMVGRDNDWASCRQTNAEVFPLRDPVAGVPFHFVTVADFSPYAMRREAFYDIGARARLWHGVGVSYSRASASAHLESVIGAAGGLSALPTAAEVSLRCILPCLLL